MGLKSFILKSLVSAKTRFGFVAYLMVHHISAQQLSAAGQQNLLISTSAEEAASSSPVLFRSQL